MDVLCRNSSDYGFELASSSTRSPKARPKATASSSSSGVGRQARPVPLRRSRSRLSAGPSPTPAPPPVVSWTTTARGRVSPLDQRTYPVCISSVPERGSPVYDKSRTWERSASPNLAASDLHRSERSTEAQPLDFCEKPYYNVCMQQGATSRALSVA